jgi:sterol desaturase/sphingolipid hydroxylase (fatty acid hydroxylase superfamily)
MIRLGVAVLLTLAMIAWEIWRPANPGKRDWLINVEALVLLVTVQIFAVPFVLNATAIPPLLDGSRLPFWLGLIVFVLAMDLGEYLFHRAQHAIPWLWKLHSLHHSDPNMSALTANRHFWGDPLLKAVTIWPAAGALIQPTPGMLAIYLWMGLWHTVVHTNIRLDFGRLSWLLNSPAYHRRHHSSDPSHFNSNFSALFPIFDVLSGAYHRPDGYPETGQPDHPKGIIDAALWPVRS